MRKGITVAELEKQVIKLLWDKNQYEDAIAITRKLLKRKPRYPLYYLILSDCYKGIGQRPVYVNTKLTYDHKAPEKARYYWDKAIAPDSIFTHSNYYEQGIKEAAQYLLETQDLERHTESEMKRLQELSAKQVIPGELYEAIQELGSISKDPSIRLKYWELLLKKAKWGYNETLYSFDLEGNSANPTLEEFKKAKLKDPKCQIIFVVSYKDPITEEVTQHTFNILKNYNLEPPSESVIKSRQRRKRYYDNHKEERLEYQKLYDRKNHQRKRARNKLDYSWRRSGLTKRQAFPRESLNSPESI